MDQAYGEINLEVESTDPDCRGDFTNVQGIIDSKTDHRYRVIAASSGPCNEYHRLVTRSQSTVGNPQTEGVNFISAFKHIHAINTPSNGSIFIPASAFGNEGTTYIYRGILEPQKAGQYGYGPQEL